MRIKEEGGGSAGRAQTLNVVKQRDMTNRGRGGILLFLPLFFASFKREMRRVYPRARVSVRLRTKRGRTFVKARRVPYDRILNVDGGKNDSLSLSPPRSQLFHLYLSMAVISRGNSLEGTRIVLSKSDARFLPRLANKLGKGKGRKRRGGGELGGREIIRQRPPAACSSRVCI